MAGRPTGKRCAIYTRKSSDERLEQSFNSLDAQREACEAYVVSQKHEGWTLLKTAYDDGGYSGGTTNRPALQTLLSDIESSEVDVIVVYKVDRLTRSLADFAKIVEVLDAKEWPALRKVVLRIEVSRAGLEFCLSRPALRKHRLRPTTPLKSSDWSALERDELRRIVPTEITTVRDQTYLQTPQGGSAEPRPDQTLIKALAPAIGSWRVQVL